MNNRVLMTVLAALGASAAFFMFALKPKRAESEQLKTDVAAAQTSLDEARTLLAANQKAKLGYQQAYTSVIRLGKAVPADDDVRSLMVQLDAAAKKTRVDFRSIDVTSSGAAPAAAPAAVSAASLPPGVAVGAAGFPAMPFTFDFNGDFFNLSDFFDELDEFVELSNSKLDVTGRLLTVDSLSLEPDTTGFPKIKAKVGATSFLVSPEQGVTNGATPAGPAGVPAAGAAPGGTASAIPPVPSTATSTGVLR